MPPPTLVPLLHAGTALSPTSFSVHTSTVVGIAALAALYRWRASIGAREGQPPIGRARPALLAIALTVLFLAVVESLKFFQPQPRLMPL